MCNLMSLAWDEKFVLRWTECVAREFDLVRNGPWVRAPLSSLSHKWLRAPLLSYTDASASLVRNIASAAPEGGSRSRIFFLADDANSLEPGMPVVMRLPLKDCTEDDVFRHHLSSGCRNRLRKAQKSGLAFSWLQPDDQALSEAWSILRQVHQRHGTPLFQKTFLVQLMRAGLARTGLARDAEGEPVAMLVYVSDGRIAWVPWCGAVEGGHKLSPNHITHWYAILHALESGCSVFDFGRSPYLGGTYEFKRKWGARPVPVLEFQDGRIRPAATGYWLARAFSSTWRRLPHMFSDALGPKIFRALAL